ncbi:permease-like cell division protein FtsX [Streptosporangium sp. NPDC023615]|uniref:permease-like cell division protein FtsX n=1 Tax=Streptosporangium sp. NPDC023615 TaxID=3154794 RepID=UPI0034354D2E
MLLGAAGTAAWYVHHDAVRVLPPPEGPWPEGGRFTVYLCAEADPNKPCREREITPAQKRSVEERLRAMPEVARITFVPRETAWARYVDEDPDNWILNSPLDMGRIQASFEGELHRRADFASFGTVMQGMPGVAEVTAFGHDFWKGKAELHVELCRTGKTEPDETPETPDPCARRGAATTEEKKAVEARLTALEGVERVYFEDAAHAHRVWRHTKVSRDSLFVDFLLKEQAPEGYRVKLADPKAERAVIDAVKNMPGVAQARPRHLFD